MAVTVLIAVIAFSQEIYYYASSSFNFENRWCCSGTINQHSILTWAGQDLFQIIYAFQCHPSVGRKVEKLWNCPDSYVFSHQIYAYFLCRAVKFSAKLFSKALAKRQKAVILYATETGKSERYAKMLGELFSHAFDPKVRNVWLWDYVTVVHGLTPWLFRSVTSVLFLLTLSPLESIIKVTRI